VNLEAARAASTHLTQLGDMMQQPPPDLEQLAPTSATELHGRRVGPYLLESELGRGGMGSVWLARRVDGYYEAKVAIKLLVASWFGTEGAVRFRHEGKLLARLDHPNIARLLDAGITDLGEPYLVLEYVEGQRIDVYCANASLGLKLRIELFLELLSAVGHAHRNLIVHRDIKPANVLVTATGQAKLLDFGIGKLVQGEEELTSTGQRILTPQFAAPEQLLGEPVTTSTDIYALGLLLYVLLTGRLPHAGSPAELIRRITVGDTPPPPSVAMTRGRLGADLHPPIPPEITRALQREVRGDLDNVVLKALQPAPSERYEDVGAFAADLRRFLNHEPVSARPSTLAYRARKFMQRNRTSVIVSALLLLAIVIGSVTTISQTFEARRQRAEAEYQERSVELISDFLNLALFSEGGPDRPMLTMVERIERGIKLVESQYGNDPKFAGRMLLEMAGRLSTPGDMARPLKLLQRVYEFGVQAKDVDLMAQAQCTMVTSLLQSGMTPGAQQRLEVAQRLIASLPESQLDARVLCLVAQAKLEQLQRKREQAVATYQRALALFEREKATMRHGYTAVMTMLSGAYIDQSNFAAAITLTQRIAQLEEQSGRADTSEYLTTRQNAATLMSLVGEIKQSMAERERITPLMRKFSAADEMPLPYIANQAILLIRLARAPAALEMLAAPLQRVRAASNPAMLLQLLNLQSWAAHETHQPNRVADALQEAQTLLDQGLGGPGMRAQLEVRRAQLAMTRRDLAAAHEYIEQALKTAGYGAQRHERSLPRILMSAAEIALASSRTRDAERFAREALRLSEAVARGPDSSADVGESLLLLVKATPASPSAERLGQLQRAVRCLQNALGMEHPLTIEAQAVLTSLRA